jgi:2'-5' RNA ligase
MNEWMPPPPEVRCRLFFALVPEAAVRARIAAAVAALLDRHRPRGRRVAPQRYHLTLQFLGDFPGFPEPLADAARAAAARLRAPAFDLRLDIAGCFARHPALPWWLGCRHAPALQGLWNALGEALAEAGVPVRSGRLAPHVTVLRNASRALLAEPLTPVHWPVRDFALLLSRPGSGQPYAELGRWPLLQAGVE